VDEPFRALLNLLGVNDVRQTAIHTTGPVVPEPSAFEFEIAIEKLIAKKTQEIGIKSHQN